MSAKAPKGRYLLDARAAMSQSTGVGNYIRGLARGFAELREEDSEETLVLFTSSWSQEPDQGLQELARAPGLELQHRRIPVRALNFLWHKLRQPSVERVVGSVDIAHSPHPLLLPSSKAAQIATVHDLYFVEEPDHTFGEVRRDYGVLLWANLARADAVLCVSQSTRNDLLHKAETAGQDPEALAAKITVTPNGVSTDFFATPGDEPSDDNAGPFVLAVGRIEPRKNPDRILEAFAGVVENAPELHDLKLVWAGMPADTAVEKTFNDLVARHNLTERVEVLGYVDQAKLRCLYQSARVLLFPSLHEGFGLPILEAMASGCPVLTSTVTAMPEVSGDAATLVDPRSTSSIVEGLRHLLTLTQDSRELESMVERGRARAAEFTWRSTAEKTLEVYRRLKGGN